MQLLELEPIAPGGVVRPAIIMESIAPGGVVRPVSIMELITPVSVVRPAIVNGINSSRWCSKSS